jgi:hypothetical protein
MGEARMGEKRNSYRLLVGKPEGKRPLGRLRLRWVDNIRMDLGEVEWGHVDWIGLAQDKNRWRALVDSVLILIQIYTEGIHNVFNCHNVANLASLMHVVL